MCTVYVSGFGCDASSVYADAYSNGHVKASSGNFNCHVTLDGDSYCREEV